MTDWINSRKMKDNEKYILKYDEFILESNSREYEKLYEEYKRSRYNSFKDFIKYKSNRAKDISKNLVGAFKKEGLETAEMASVFNRLLRKKLNLKNRKDTPTKEELDEALKQLKDVPKLLPFAAVMLAAPIPGSSTMYIIFGYFLNKKTKGKINILPDSFYNVLNKKEENQD